MEATHTISAVYFPKQGEAEITIECINEELGREQVALTVKVTEQEGEQLAKTVMPCTYWGAITQDRSATEEELKILRMALYEHTRYINKCFTIICTKGSRDAEGREFTRKDIDDAGLYIERLRKLTERFED